MTSVTSVNNEKRWYKNPIVWGVIVLLMLFAVFVCVMTFDTVAECAGHLLGLDGNKEKYEILSFIGIAMGGVLIALQAYSAYKRAKAMEEAASAQAEASKAHAEANQSTERGQRQERLKNAIEHLGHDSDSVRLGGAYELFHLAKDTLELRQTVLDILCARIRHITNEKEYQSKHLSKPSGEIQNLLDLLFINNHRIFSECYINLEGSHLNGAELSNARLIDANLRKANLNKAVLLAAKMQGAVLSFAQMQASNLAGAEMQAARLFSTQLQGADLSSTQMQAAYLYHTEMEGAHFFDTKMAGVNYHSRLIGQFQITIKRFVGVETDLHWTIFNNELPEGIVIGSYTEEEANKWIEEYRLAKDPFGDVH